MSTHTFEELMLRIDKPNTKSGELKKIAKEIKKDQDLAEKLWETGKYYPRLLSILILDRNELTLEKIEAMAEDLSINNQKEQNHIGDWLLANQLTKSKGLKLVLEGLEDNSHAFLRRIYWYHQARLRWTGQTPPDNTSELVDSIKKKLAAEEPEVQEAINFCAGYIGIYDENYSEQIKAFGEALGLYKGMKVPKGCVPWYLPDFIQYEQDRLKHT